jgi:hypothetical protein
VDLWDLTRLLLRRWYFAVPMLLLSVAAVVGAAMTVSPDYKAMGYMQLIPAPSIGKMPDPKAKPRPANPWLDLGYAALGNASALTVTEQSSLEKLAADGYSDSVTVVLNERTPLFEIEAVGNSKQQATRTVQQVIKLLQTDIAAKQAQYGTLPEDTISTLVINDGSSPEQDSGKVKRVLIVAAGVGLLLTTGLTIALDYWLRRRKRRKARDDGNDVEKAAMPEPTVTDNAKPVRAVQPEAPKPARPASIGSAELTRRLRPTRPETLPRKPTQANGKVYSSERHLSESAARGTVHNSNGSQNGKSAGAAEPGVEATIVLPPSHPARRNTDKRP